MGRGRADPRPVARQAAGSAAAKQPAGGTHPSGKSTTDGVYTAAQAAKGEELYAQTCEHCHQPAKFTGAEFTRAYVGRPLTVIDQAMAEMPQDNPGSLTADDVASLIAYFLHMNKYPAGEALLSGAPEALKSIMIAPRP